MYLRGIATLLAMTTSHVDALRRLKSGVAAPRAIGRRTDQPRCVPPECFDPDTYGLVPELNASYHMNEHFFYFVEVDLRGQRMRLLLDTGSDSMWINDDHSNPTVGCQRVVAGKYDADSSPFIYHDSDLRDEKSGERIPYNISYLDETQVHGILVSSSIRVYDRVRDQYKDSRREDKDHDVGDVKQKFGVADISGQCIGIMGIGYGDSEEPRLMSNLREQRLIASESYSLYPTRSTGGSILFGAVDFKKFYGSLKRIRMVQPKYEGAPPTVQISRSTTYNTDQPQNRNLRLAASENKHAILDVGSVLTYLPRKDVQKLIGSFEDDFKLDDNQKWSGQHLYQVDCKWLASNRYLDFTFDLPSTESFTIQIPSSRLILQTTVKTKHDTCVFGVASEEHSDGQIILGYTFFTSVYAVFDLAKRDVFLAPANVHAEESDIRDITEDGVADTLAGINVSESSPDDAESESNHDDNDTPDEEEESGDQTTTAGSDPSSPVRSDVPEQTSNGVDSDQNEGSVTAQDAFSGLFLWQIASMVVILAYM